MGSTEHQFGMGVPFIIKGMMESTACEVSTIIADSCAALAVLIWIPETMSSSGNAAMNGGQTDPEITYALRAFLRRRCQGETPTRIGGVEPYKTASGRMLVFVLIPLGTDPIGVAAVAIEQETWVDKSVFRSLQHNGKLAGMILSSARARYQLEADLAESNRRSQRLARTAEVDPLTKVENRASFEAKVRARLQRKDGAAALLALDLDEFKQINDVYGHQFGDSFLNAIAEALKESFPRSALIGRTGGDEFCVLLDMPETGRSYLESILRQVRMSVQRHIARLGRPDHGRVSIGASHFPRMAQDYTTLMRQADLALYSAKRQGRNTTVTYDCSLDAQLIGMDPRNPSFRPNTDQFLAHFQPIVCCSSGRLLGLELLARWRDEDHATIKGPASFGWMFRDHRFASKLTLGIVETALKDLARHPQFQGESRPELWINVTDCDLMSPEFIFDLQAILNDHGLSWDRVVMEVNEASLLGAPGGHLFRSLQELRRRGARIALDDFGTGYAGLTHVGSWPIDILKIDRSFVENIDHNAGAKVVVEALLMIAETLNLVVVAEGIETTAQMTAMRDLGCDLAQGYLLSKPKSAEALARHLGANPLPEALSA